MVTGIVLLVRKPVELIQPAAARGSATLDPRVAHQAILDAVRTVPQMEVSGWQDIMLTDYRPRRGIVKVRNHAQYETQVDAANGSVIKSGQRLNDIVMRFHGGSPWSWRLWVYVPVGLATLYLTLSGIYLGAVSSVRRWRGWRAQSHSRERHRGSDRFNLAKFCLRYHFWLALVVMVPWLIVVTSGLMMQLRDQVPGITNPLERGVSATPTLSYPRVLEVAKTIPELGVEGWSNIWRVYTYPDAGVIQIRTKRGVEAQLDASTGEVLLVATREKDFWEDLHEGIVGRHHLRSGQLFESKVNLSMVLFLPVHLCALVMWVLGAIYFVRTQLWGGRRQTAPQVFEPAGALPQPAGGDD